MKIKTKPLSYKEVLSLPKYKHKKPLVPNLFWQTLMKVVGEKELKDANFKYDMIGMEKLGKDQPALFLMNHSSFIDLEIVSNVLYPRKFNIVCTSDGFVGKEWLMRHLGCIPTRKFITDTVLVRDMLHSVKKLNNSILLYPEASYSFDGTTTPLPEGFGKLIKMLKIPVVMITTFGAFSYDPLYNMLQKRKVDVSAKFEYILSAEDIANLSEEEIKNKIDKCFDLDYFKWQFDNKIKIDEPFRADGLNRVLYKCPICGSESHMKGEGISLTCSNCSSTWILDEYGKLIANNQSNSFDFVPEWYKWERDEVRKEIINDSYSLDVDVDIRVMKDMKCIYEIGSGKLTHNKNGFHLVNSDGTLDFIMKANESYSLYSDYYWYEIGDVICIGNNDMLYYCFPKNGKDIVAKTRLATEEIYKLNN